MSARIGHKLRLRLRAFVRAEDGAMLVEYVFALMFFLLLLFAVIDFARLSFHNVAANRAMHVAARVAAVRPPACAGVPTVNTRGPLAQNEVAPRFGTRCNAGSNICSNPGVVTCAGSVGNATSAEIWALVSGTLPNGSTPANLKYSYSYDSDLGFLGGPFTPLVTVELQNVTFQFVSPLAALVTLAGGAANANPGSTISLASMSVTMPGEDLAQGGGN